MPSDRDAPLLEARGLTKHFRRAGFGRGPRAVIRAVDGVDLTVERGRTLGLVGESGCGKTTTGRLLVLLERPTTGEIRLEGIDYAGEGRDLRAFRRRIQMVFQDPSSSLDPRMSIRATVSEPLDIGRIGSAAERRDRVEMLLERVGLRPDVLERKPHQLSGGQRQRVGIARALASSPDIIVADEPTSALDVSIRAQIVNLLADLQAELGVSFIFISHDLSTVRHCSDDVAVMYLGAIVERGPAEELFRQPLHPYTRALIEAVPVADPEIEAQRQLPVLFGEVSGVVTPTAGCRFHPRCPLATARCRQEEPLLRAFDRDRSVACHHAA